MDYEDDTLDMYDVDSMEGDPCNEVDGEEADYFDHDGESDGYCNKDTDDHRLQQTYTVLKEEDIKQRQKDDIEKVSTVLSISEVEASILLRSYKWCVSKVHDEWFSDGDRVRRTVGILEKPVVPPSCDKELTCGICFESYPREDIASAVCGHPFCTGCWAGYIGTAVKDGPGCLMLRCPDPSCVAAIGHDLVDKLASDEDKEKYNRFFLRSYIEDNRKTKWCPAPGCEYAIDFAAGTEDSDVSCLCSHNFCWNCAEDAHRPVDCDTVAKWILKNASEAENVDWMLVNSKLCPQCKRPIEKNKGCMHMTCTAPCQFEFCWLCLGIWSEHAKGLVSSCNEYKAKQMAGLFEEEEKKRTSAKKSLEKYMHYYQRWASNEMSRKKAMEELQNLQTKTLEKLSDIHCTPVCQLQFIREAWLQIIECRRVLKWTYAYGYYLPERQRAKKQFFEYLQGEAEAGLEKLHACAEKELVNFMDEKKKSGPSSTEFDDFRAKLISFTGITRNYFENLVRALQSNLAEVETRRAWNRRLKNAGESSNKGRARAGKRKASS